MSDYKRLISYIYEYEGKTKGKNVGFVKLEARNGQCRLNVNVKKVYVGGNAVGVFLLGKDQQETFLGNIFIRGGNGEFRAMVDAGNVEGSGNSLDTYYGLTIHDVRSTWRCYTTIWEDSVAHMAQDTLPGPEEKASDGTHAVSKVVKEIEDEIAREEERRSQKEKAGNRQPDAGEDAIARAAQVGLAEKLEEEPGEREEQKLPGESGAKEGSGKTERTRGTEEMKERENGERRRDPVIVNFRGRAGGENGEDAERQPAGNTGSPEENRGPSSGAMAGLSFLSGFMSPLSGQMPPKGSAPTAFERQEPGKRGGLFPAMGAGLPQPGNRSVFSVRQDGTLHQDMTPPGEIAGSGLRNQAETIGQNMIRTGSSGQETVPAQQDFQPKAEPPADGRTEVRPEETVPLQENRSGEETMPEAEATAGENSGNEDPGQKEETVSPELENEAVLRYLRETEETGGNPEKLWQELRKSYPKIQPFDYDEGCEILTVRPQDIGRLPREAWVYGNNSFLLHGYYSFRYLILVRLGNSRGKPRYLLGVPGHYYSNEKYMAAMFGFPNFVLSKKQPPNDGRFGYWYTDIRMG